MSAFTENALVKKLMELNPSQQSIQTLSLWLIHHRKHHQTIVRSWFKELMKVSENKKLTFMYLANDVIQNSKKKGPEYGKEFSKILNKAFEHIGETCQNDEKVLASLGRILNIWGERAVYDRNTIDEYRKLLTNAANSNSNDEISNEGVAGSSSSGGGGSNSSTSGAGASRSTKRSGHKSDKNDSNHRHQHHHKRHKSQSSSSSSHNRDHVKSETIEVNGTVETHVILSPQTPAGDPPEPEELIKALLDLEQSASSDAAIRERIANLPPEVTEVGMLQKLEDKESAAKLAIQVNEAVLILNEYNARLSVEMEDRKRLTIMLKDFQIEQRELLAQAEHRLQEYNAKLRKVRDVQKEIRNHLHNLPDLTQLPDVTGGLLPLPSAGDLFNIH